MKTDPMQKKEPIHVNDSANGATEIPSSEISSSEVPASTPAFDPSRYGIVVLRESDHEDAREYWLLGTAHISRDSVVAVEETIRQVGIDHVVVEIDHQRYQSVTQKRDWSQLDIFQILRTGQAFLLLSNLVLASFQRRMGAGTGVTPGEEMIAAVKASSAEGIGSTFGDRPVTATLRRAWAKTGFWGRNKLLASMIAAAFSREKVSEEDLAKLREQNELESMLQELSDYLPQVKEVLIDERDRYLARSIYDAPGRRVLAVVGAGHVPGIARTLEQLRAGTVQVNKAELEEIPPPGAFRRALPYAVPAVVGSLILWGFFRGGLEGGLQSLGRWILVNGTLSAVGAAAALAHPLTILLAFAAAPITSMNPTVGVGLVTGLVEAFLRKPRVADFERLNDDIVSVRGFYRNRLTRILLVFLLSSVGSSIGTFIALPLLFG
ncbi:pheromone shutdown-related protein TraB [Alkalispirochaeta americana]|uniref:Pheromone shutdown-related protein TraB n=1 Tax=Alkalispirochaeta americana TaxID=159291 RepID=A0A1N6RHX7_9SPIO|nr:TraB/GumN family protein [Alkalispirochaeta americana]SIQ28508.1 pheromone shutdown-related protein TraB [Alkalispirochaeta americana]